MSASRSTSTTNRRFIAHTNGPAVSPVTSRRRSARITTAVIAVLLLLGAAACASDATLTETAATATPGGAVDSTPAEATEPAPAPTTQTEPAETSSPRSPSEILRQANAAWRAQDWAGLGNFATPDAVAVAQAAGSPEDEGPLELVGDNLDNAWRCSLDGASCNDGLWSCDAGGTPCNGEILYGYEPDADCCAAIYRVTLADTGNGFQVTSLSFAGDAG